MRKRNNIVIFGLLLLSFISTICADTESDIICDPKTGELVLKIDNEDFRKCVHAIIEEAPRQGKKECSPELLRCYAQLLSEEKKVNIFDLEKALPEIFNAIDGYCSEHGIDPAKAPRPSPNINQGIVGPGCCDLNSVIALLSSLFAKLNVCCSTNIIDFQSTWTILAAGFNGTFSLLDDVISILTTLTLCAPTPLTAPITITNPGYYCLANDVSGSFFISANNVVLDLNSHTISGGGITVAPGTNRIIKNGRLDVSTSGIALVANANTTIQDLYISHPTAAAAISFLGSALDNTVRNVVIESGITGLAGVSDTNSIIEDVNIDTMSSVAITFTGSNNLVLRNVLIANISNDGINLTNPINATLSDLSINNVGNCGILTYGTTTGCVFENINVAQVTETALNRAAILLGNVFGPTGNASDCVLRNCVVTNVTSPNVGATGIAVAGGPNVIESCVVAGVSSPGFAVGIGLAEGSITGGSNVLRDCVVQSITCDSDGANGYQANFVFGTQSSDNTYYNCIAEDIVSAGGSGNAYGFYPSLNDQLFNCFATTVFSINANLAVGFNFDTNSILCHDCVANNISSPAGGDANGFLSSLGTVGLFLNNCSAHNISNGNGFQIGDSSTLNYCQAINCHDNGFVNNVATGVTLLACSATGCGIGIDAYFGGANTNAVCNCFTAFNTNESFNTPNVQHAGVSPALTGYNLQFP